MNWRALLVKDLGTNPILDFRGKAALVTGVASGLDERQREREGGLSNENQEKTMHTEVIQVNDPIPNSNDGSSLSGLGHSRRDFIVLAATTLASVGAANLLNLQPAQGADEKNSVAIGNGPYPAEGVAAYSQAGPHKLMTFQRRALGSKDVAIKIHYCGVCHSDIHTIRGDWGKIQYPQIVGHELAGEVVAVGSSVSKFTVGARVGVGTMVNSCRICTECQAGHENYCLNGNTQTYGSKDQDGTITQGGYSTLVVVDEDFVIHIPDAIDLAAAGPLLCAGITVYSPLRRWAVSPGKKVAIVGMGGLGHLAVKLATALGAEVTVFTTSPDKTEDAKRFGAKDVVIKEEGADFSKFKHKFDFALDTVPYKHDLNRFIPLQ